MIRTPLLDELIGREILIEIVDGRLVLETEIPEESSVSLDGNQRDRLVGEIARLMSLDLYQFRYHTTGKYGGFLGGGITLHFESILSRVAHYAVFNVDVTKAKSSKAGNAGSKRPKGQFTPKAGGAFSRFWRRLLLPQPARPSTMHKKMHLLKHLVLAAEPLDESKLDKNSIKLAQIDHQSLIAAFRDRERFRTDARLPEDERETLDGYTEYCEVLNNTGLERVPGTRHPYHGSSHQDGGYTTDVSVQSTDEWLKAYDN